jgi:succinate dehydrogenase/fumarate reductase flavoprotein subunit
MASGQERTSISLLVFLPTIVDRQRMPLSCSINTSGLTPLLSAADTALQVASDWKGHPPALPRLANTSHRPFSSLLTVTNRVPQPTNKKKKKRKIGGQKGHPKHNRPLFEADEIDKTIIHKLPVKEVRRRGLIPIEQSISSILLGSSDSRH